MINLRRFLKTIQKYINGQIMVRKSFPIYDKIAAINYLSNFNAIITTNFLVETM